MPLKSILSRPSTSASNKRVSTLETTPQNSYKSTKSAKGTKTAERGHRKIGSLQRLSLSFTPSHDNENGGGTFHNFLTNEPDLISREGSLADLVEGSSSRQRTGTTQEPVETVHPASLPLPKTDEKEEDERAKGTGGEVASKPQRFSLMRFRHASEPQLSTRYKEGETFDGHLPPPKIITTAPTHHHEEEHGTKIREKFLPRTFSTIRKSMVMREGSPLGINSLTPVQPQDLSRASTPNLKRALSENSPWIDKSDGHAMTYPPAYGDESNSALALPTTRLSESSRSEGSSGSHKIYAQTTTTHFIETTTTIFKLKRGKKKPTKDKGPLFPLPEKLPPPGSGRTSISQSDAASGRKSISPSRKSTNVVRWKSNLGNRPTPHDSPNASATALANAPLGSPGLAAARRQSLLSTNSGNSTPTGNLIPPRLGARGRSSTLGSLGRSSERLADPNQMTGSSRTSTSTVGRRSFGDILTQRLRKESAPPRHGSGSGSSLGSKANSFQIARESEPELSYPAREEEDTPATYLEKLEAAVPRGAMATILCKNGDDFSKTCLRKYMRGFSYFGESIDMSIRKMLMEVILPKETQQIDRLLTGFADRYHECNPGVFMNSDEANFVAFSILLLQSDNHNKNNKRKMSKQDYVKNTQNGRISVAEDVLECFYDNICYTPFIHFDDEIAVENHRLTVPKRKGGLIRSKSSEMLRGPIDPYSLLLDHKLEMLRPSLRDVIDTDDTYSTSPINTVDNHKAFVHSAVLQIVSARSRPDAFTNQATITNPAEAQAGLVSIKVAKVGLLWRKSTKKKKAKSPWQEWGVILTDSKLYFFKDIGWVRKLISQHESHAKAPNRSTPLVFKPPLVSFEPDAWMAMDDAVALLDASYKKHKNAFTFIKHGGFEEIFLGNSEADVVDWISKLNYAATFRTAGVRMRGLLGTNYEGRNIYWKDSEVSMKTGDTQLNDQPTPISGKTNPQLTWEIMFYRRQLVSEKISHFDDHVAAAQKELDYLQRNARHLLILLPIQQKTREAIVFAAARMNAKLKWTRKEIWRAKTHRDILIKDLEAEATQAFPAPAVAPLSSRGSTTFTTPLKTTPTKTTQSSLGRSDTDQTPRSNLTKSPLSTAPQSATATRRPSQAVLEHITTDTSEPPEPTTGRRRSSSSQIKINVSPQILSAGPNPDEDRINLGRPRTPSLRTQPSQHLSLTNGSQAAPEPDADEHLFTTASLNTNANNNEEHEPIKQRTSESERDRDHKPSAHALIQLDGGLKDRTGSVRRSLHRTLRDSSNPLHLPHHSRSKKGKESGSSLGLTEDGRSIMSQESEELKRDPTGRFVLHGKKASVITMGPEWNLSSEDRIRIREQMLADKNNASAIDGEADSTNPLPHRLHIDTEMIDAKRRSIDTRSLVSEPVSPGATKDNPESEPKTDSRHMRNSTAFSVYSAVTTPGLEDTFHSAKSSPTLGYSSDEEAEGASDEDDKDDKIEDGDDKVFPHDDPKSNHDTNTALQAQTRDTHTPLEDERNE